METFIAGIQNLELRMPSEHYDSIQRLSMTGRQTGNRNKDNIPFLRNVDFWWLALCIGIQEGNRTTPDKWHTFVRAGLVLPADQWRLFQLQIMAIGETNSTDVLAKPSNVIDMANEYAATGFPVILDKVLGSQVPLWTITEIIKTRLT